MSGISLMKQHFIALTFMALFWPCDAQESNRGTPPVNLSASFRDRCFEGAVLAEPELWAKIATFNNDELKRLVNEEHFDLKWQRRIDLRGTDYILCLFDSSMHFMPGENPRVLMLFTPDYQLKTWGRFTCEPSFDHGYVINRHEPQFTCFVTINPAYRFGGALFFEKYLIDPEGIQKLGEGMELTKIPDRK